MLSLPRLVPITKIMTILTDAFVWVIVSSILTTRCALYKKKSMRNKFLEKAVVELVYKFDEKSYRKCLKR